MLAGSPSLGSRRQLLLQRRCRLDRRPLERWGGAPPWTGYRRPRVARSPYCVWKGERRPGAAARWHQYGRGHRVCVSPIPARTQRQRLRGAHAKPDQRRCGSAPVNQTLLAHVMAEYPPNATRGADNRPLAARACRLLVQLQDTAAAGSSSRSGRAGRSPSSTRGRQQIRVPPTWACSMGTRSRSCSTRAVGWRRRLHASGRGFVHLHGGRVVDFSRDGDVLWPASPEIEWLFRAGASKAQPYTDAARCDFWDRNLPPTTF